MKRKKICKELNSLRSEVSLIRCWCKTIDDKMSKKKETYIDSLERSAALMEKLCEEHTAYMHKYLM